MYRLPAFVIFTSLLFFTRVTAVNTVLPHRYSGFLVYIAGAVIYYLYLNVSRQSFFSFDLFVPGSIILFCLFVQFFYTAGTAEKVFLSVSLCLPAIIAGHIFSALKIQPDHFGLLLLFLTNLFLLIPMVFLLRKNRLNDNPVLNSSELMPYCIFLLSQLLVLLFFRPAVSGLFPTIPVLLISIASDYCLILLFNQRIASIRSEARNEIYEAYISSLNQSDDMIPAYRDLAKIRHDIDNHMLAMKTLLGSGRQDEAMEYLHSVETSYREITHFPACMNSTAALFLERKYEEAIQAGISFQSDIQLPGKLNISDQDLISIYGNIMDNAIEACHDAADPEIILNTVYQDPYLTITCSNSFSAASKKEERIPGLKRGLGTAILSDIANQYDGQFLTETRCSMFFTEIILKVQPEVNHDQDSIM